MIHQSNAHLISYKFTFLICAFYVACSALRLARYNVESTSEFSAHHHFTGLPTPGAAGFIASMIILNYEFTDTVLSRLVPIALPFAVLILAVLMVSRLNYVHLLNRVTQTKHPFIRLAEIILIGLIVAFFPEKGLFVAFLIYILSTPVATLYFKLFPSTKPKPGLIMPEKSHVDLPTGKTGV
jgi:CDP-diacylglycerol--serine O-phosphatidyltransferase